MKNQENMEENKSPFDPIKGFEAGKEMKIFGKKVTIVKSQQGGYDKVGAEASRVIGDEISEICGGFSAFKWELSQNHDIEAFIEIAIPLEDRIATQKITGSLLEFIIQKD